MFHRFEPELGRPDYLVRTTSFEYTENPVASFIKSTTQSGYVRQPDGRYLQILPPLEFTYSQAAIDETIHLLDHGSLEHLPME